jgi:hypothetical protein
MTDDKPINGARLQFMFYPNKSQTTPPTEPGYYWVKSKTGNVSIERVFAHVGELCIHPALSEAPVPVSEADFISRWLGPLPVPEMEEEGGE